MKLYRFLEPDETIAEGDVEDYYGDLEEVAEQDVGRDACDGLRGTGIWRLVAELLWRYVAAKRKSEKSDEQTMTYLRSIGQVPGVLR